MVKVKVQAQNLVVKIYIYFFSNLPWSSLDFKRNGTQHDVRSHWCNAMASKSFCNLPLFT